MMDLATAMIAGPLAAQIEKSKAERESYAAMLGGDGELSTITINVTGPSEAKAVLSAVLGIYDDRIAALEAELGKL